MTSMTPSMGSMILLYYYILVGIVVISDCVVRGAQEEDHNRTAASSLSSSSSALPRPRVINGTPSNPLSATFFVKTDRDQYFWTPDTLCGGTLIHDDIIVTAAHCFGGYNYGVLVYNPATEQFDRRIVIDRQLRHPIWDFDTGILNYDIAVSVCFVCRHKLAALCAFPSRHLVCFVVEFSGLCMHANCMK
jgi:Trypsin